MPHQIPMLTMLTVVPAILLGAAAVAVSLRAPRSELAYYLGVGVSVLGVVIAVTWFWHSGRDLYSAYTLAALSPVLTGTFALSRAVK
jgi:lipopolysaccharide export LptBFGC system permease protein LptF